MYQISLAFTDFSNHFQTDAEGLPCYIESSNVLNNPLYERLGFSTRKQIYLSPHHQKIKMDIMVREPVREKKEGQYEPHSGVRSEDANGVEGKVARLSSGIVNGTTKG